MSATGRSHSRSFRSNNSNSLKAADYLRLFPLVVFTSVIFLLVRVHAYSLPLSQFDYMAERDDTILYDCFAYVKMIAVLAVSVLSIALMTFYFITGRRRIRWTPIYIPMGLYAFIIVLSHFLSEYSEFTLLGSYERFEGTLPSLCYLIMMFYAINFIDDDRECKFLTDTLFVGVTIACLIGLTQLFGHDFFSYGLGRHILMGSLDGEVEFNFGKGQIYQTVYNINYVGVYMCLVIPLLLSRMIDIVQMVSYGVCTVPQKAYLAWLIALLILVAINVIGADSEGSIPGIVFAVMGTLIVKLAGKYRIKCFVVLIAGYIVVFFMALFGLFGDKYSILSEDITDRPDIEYIKTTGDNIEYLINGYTFIVKYNRATGDFTLIDENGIDYPIFTLPEDEYRYQIDDERLNGIVAFTPIITKGRLFAIVDTEDEQWTFEYTDDGVRYVNSVGNRVVLDRINHAGVINNYLFGSGRGYIWDSTLTIIGDKPLIGSGADTFMFRFPQHDYAVRYSHGLTTDCVYDKPHNMFLQIAVYYGITGLAAFILIIVCFLIIALKQMIALKETTFTMTIMIGVVAFLISAIVNDSSIHVMPMFYGLLGAAVANNSSKIEHSKVL